MTHSKISIGDVIAQFAAAPKPKKGVSEVQEWFTEFKSWLENDYESTVHPPRKPGLHASSLAKICGRRRLLIAAFGEHQVPNTAGNYFTYDVGHSLHWWWQERYLGPKQELWGDWVCMGCPCPECGPLMHSAKTREERRSTLRHCSSCRATGGKVTRSLMPLECECGKPWQEAVHFLELPVEDAKLGYVGHTDGIIVNGPKRRVFEFKTMSPSEYEKLERRASPYKNGPTIAHVIQAHAYMGPLGLDEALIVYWNKGSQCKWKVNTFGQFEARDVKVIPFMVKFDNDIWDPIVDRIHIDHQARAALQTILDEGRQPSQEDIAKFPRICETKTCILAARCEVSRECFGLSTT